MDTRKRRHVNANNNDVDQDKLRTLSLSGQVEVSRVKAEVVGDDEDELFSCVLDDCHYRTKSPKEMDNHEKVTHFGWAYEHRRRNEQLAFQLLVRNGERWMCLACDRTLEDEATAVCHVTGWHSRHPGAAGMVQVRCRECQFASANADAVRQHYKLRHIINLSCRPSPAKRAKKTETVQVQIKPNPDYFEGWIDDEDEAEESDQNAKIKPNPDLFSGWAEEEDEEEVEEVEEKVAEEEFKAEQLLEGEVDPEVNVKHDGDWAGFDGWEDEGNYGDDAEDEDEEDEGKEDEEEGEEQVDWKEKKKRGRKTIHEKPLVVQMDFLPKEAGDPLRCDRCDLRLGSQKEVAAHALEHLDLSCSGCDASCKGLSELHNHQAKAHGVSPKSYRCSLCAKEFRNGQIATLFRFHLLRKHLPRRLQPHLCPLCGAGFIQARDLANHADREHGAAACEDIMAQQDITEVLDMDYLPRKQGDRLECRRCDGTFESQKEVAAHALGHLDLSCSLCDFMCLGLGKLINHMSNEHTPEQIRTGYNCSLCGRLFSGRNRLATALRQHMFRVHLADSLQPYICPHCGRGFIHSRLILRHAREQHGQDAADELQPRLDQTAILIGCKNEVVCGYRGEGGDGEECRYTCGGVKAMREHKAVEHGLMNGATDRGLCMTCGATVARKSMWRHEYQEHQVIRCRHYGCPFVAATRQEMAAHRANDHKPWRDAGKKEICAYCGVAVHAGSMRKHIRNKHGKKFDCKKCDFTTGTLANFEHHSIFWHAEMCRDCGMPLDPKERRVTTTMKQHPHFCPAVVGPADPAWWEFDPDAVVKTRAASHVILSDYSYICTACNYRCPNRDLIHRHKALMHRQQNCPDVDCNVVTADRLALLGHMESQHPEMCTHCGVPSGESHDCDRLLFFGESPLMCRISRPYRPNGCRFCGYISKNYTGLIMHLKVKHDGKVMVDNDRLSNFSWQRQRKL